MLALFPLSYRFFINPKRHRAAADESVIVLLPVVYFVRWFRNETTEFKNVADQIVSFEFSSIDLRSKVVSWFTSLVIEFT
ncbi:hypothetical protein IFVP182_C240021 [Vibrio parahaemolyticus]